MATRWNSKHTGQKIDDTIDCVCNPNLLDNWYFGNPVNQRGVTKYTGAGYTIDRWKTANSNLTVELTSDGIVLSNGGSTAVYLSQYFEGGIEVEDVCTISTLVKAVAGTAYFQVGYSDSTYGTPLRLVSGLNAFSEKAKKTISRALFQLNSGTSVTIKAAKLELGDQQTLAHQDADGNWMLNEIPNYGEQLIRCQRYFIRIGVPSASENGAIAFVNCANTTLANAVINTPVTMRALPTATLKNIVLRKGVTDFSVTGSNVFAITGNGIYMNFISSGLTTGDSMIVRTVTGGYVDFNADL